MHQEGVLPKGDVYPESQICLGAAAHERTLGLVERDHVKAICDEVAPCSTLGWADTIKMVHERHPEVAESILEAVEAGNQAPSIVAINNSVENLVATGFTPPSWEELSSSGRSSPCG